MRTQRIGWNVPGTMSRLGLHMGMVTAWVLYRLPLPTLVVASSAGAIIMACCVSFDRTVLRRVRHVVERLRRDQIYVISAGLTRMGVHLLAAGGTLIVAATAVGGLGWFTPPLLLLAVLGGYVRVRGTRTQLTAIAALLVILGAMASWRVPMGWASIVVFGIALTATDMLVRRAIAIYTGEVGSPFDNAPLRKLLLDQDVPRTAFAAATELRIVAADVQTPGILVYGNHDALRCDPDNPAHVARFVDGILGSAALPGRFNLRDVAGKVPRDGEVWTDVALEEFRGQVDIVFRFDYWDPLQPAPAPTGWLEDLFRCFDVMRDRATQERMERYELERRADPSLPRVVCIRASKRLLAQIPELAVYSFKPGQLARSIVLGMRIVRENRHLIRRELGL